MQRVPLAKLLFRIWQKIIHGKEDTMAYKAVVITVSDRCSRGEATETSGPAIVEMVTKEGYEVIHTEIVPDEKERIREVLIRCADEMKADLIFTTGGTGFSKRDVTPDVTKEVVERETPGIPEAMLFESLKVTPRAMLSRMAAGIRGDSLIVNLPGSEKAARENLGAILGTMEHALHMMAGKGH